MKHRLPFAGKICALVLGCLLVWGGVRGQVDYWSEVGNVSPFNLPSNNWNGGAMCYNNQNGNLYLATANYPNPALELAIWNGISWSVLPVPSSIVNSIQYFYSWMNVTSMCADNYGNIYIGGCYAQLDPGSNNGARTATYIIKYNGSNWSVLLADSLLTAGATSMCYDSTHNYLYAGLSSGLSIPLVYRWDSNNWIQVGSFPQSFASYQENVFMSNGNLYATANNSSNNLYQWNGASWVPLDNVGFPTYSSGIPICSGPGNKFYAAGADISSGADCIYEWNGTSWSILGNSNNPLNINLNHTINSVLADGVGNVYAAGDFYDENGYRYVLKWNGQTWAKLGDNNFALHANSSINSLAYDSARNIYAIGNFANSDGLVYVAEYHPIPPGRAFVFLNETPTNCGTTGSIASIVYNGTQPYTYAWSNGDSSANLNSLSGGTYYVTVTDAHGSIASGDIIVTSSCLSVIAGTVFVDTAGTCGYNSQQAGVTNVTLTLSGHSQTLYATTDAQGRYSFAVSDTGNYHLYIQVGNGATCGNFTLCGNPSQTIHVGVLGDTVSGNNFALKPDASSFDLYLHPGWTSADPGFEKDYWVYFANNSPIPFTGSATVAFKYDPNLTFISSDIPYTSYSAAADSFTWVVNNFSNTGWNFIGRVRFNVPSTLPLGYQLHSQFWIYPDGGDCDTSNNYLQYFETVKGSHDPNYKEVSPAGYSTAVDSVLTYTIHYQNTGTDSTYFIIIKDTLSPYLNPATVRNLASSDNYSSFSISGTGILTWTFLPLSLPAASTDSMGSNGFITFSVNRMANTPLGTKIANTASIYFDYNGAVVTNTVTDTVVTTCTDTISQFGGLCSGDSIYFYGRWIHTPGSYDTLLVGNPCDTFVTIGIVVQDPLPPHDISDTICANDSLLFAGTYLHATGTYSHIACDSSVRLQLTVLPLKVGSVNQTICWDQTYSGHNTNGQYVDTFTTAGGCDSIRFLNLTVTPVTITYDTMSICTGQTYLGHNATGNYTDTITGINSCDKIRHLSLTVLPALGSNATATVCQGQLYLGHGTSGTYADTLIGTGGCDSIATLHLTVLPVQQTSYNQNICSGASYNFNDSLLTLTGVYTATITGANGCDSVVTLHLTVIPNPLQPFITQQGDTLISSDSTGNQWYVNDTALIGDTSNLLIVTQPGNYQVEVTGPNGCQNISAGYLYPSTGVSSLSNAFDVVLYPNPNGGMFTIQFNDNMAKEVVVTDILGQTILPAKTVMLKSEFDLSALAGGIYFLKIKDVQNNSRVVFKQVVIQH